MNHPFSQESSLWPSGKWDHCGHSDTQIHSQGGIRPWDSEICRMEVSKDAMAAVFGFTPKGRKHRVGRAEWQPGSHHPGVCSPDMWAEKSGCRGEQRRLALWSPPTAQGGDLSRDAWAMPAWVTLSCTWPLWWDLSESLVSWSGSGDITCLVTPLEKEMAIHSSTLAWRILWTEEPGGLQSIGSHRVRHNWSDLACMHALEKEMATHSSILAWRIPGPGEPGGLPSLGSHRVGHDWSDLAAAAAVLYNLKSFKCHLQRRGWT